MSPAPITLYPKYHPIPQQNCEDHAVDNRFAEISSDDHVEMEHACNGSHIDKFVQFVPAGTSQAFDHAFGGGGGQGDQNYKRKHADGDVPAFDNVLPNFNPIEELVEDDIAGPVEGNVEKSEQPDHASKPDQHGQAEQFAQRRHGQGKQQKP